MIVLELITSIICCFIFAALYTVIGYYITSLFTDSPEWRPVEQAIFWILWPLIIPMFVLAAIGIMLVGLFVILLAAGVTIYDFIMKLFNK